MRILYVSDSAAIPGGAGSGLQDQMEAQRRLGNVVAVANDHIPEAYRQFRPDLIHFHTVIVNTGLGVLEWAQWKRIPHCLTLHDFWPFCGGRMMLRSNSNEGRGEMCPTCDGACESGRAYPRIRKVVNGSPVIVNQEYQAARLRANGVRVDAIIYPGIDTDFWSPADIQANGRVVSTSAWWDCHWKGWAFLDRAFAGTGITVHRIGGVPRTTLRDVLRSANIFLFPSSYPETWGLSLAEALACGLACVASGVDGPKVQIEDGINGVLLPPRDEAAWQEAVAELLRDPARARRLGRYAAEKARSLYNPVRAADPRGRYGLDRYGRDHLRLYERLLDG